MVLVKFFASFRELTGEPKVIISGVKTVGELLSKLNERYGEKFTEQVFEDPEHKKLRHTVNILVNGRSVVLMDSLDTKISDSDSVAIFPPVSGG